jgi:hypothetical protein
MQKTFARCATKTVLFRNASSVATTERRDHLMAKGTDLDAMEYWMLHGRERVQQLCTDAGTSYDYWKHIANKRKRPSVDLAMRLVEASGGALSLLKLLPPKEALRGTGRR